MSRHLIVLAALFLASTPLAAAAQTPPPTASATAGVEVTEADREGFRYGLKAAGAGETFDLVRKHFPEDYAAFETDLIRYAKSGGANALEAQNRTFTFMRGIRDRVLPNAKRAPDADLIAYGQAQLRLMTEVKPVYPRMCYEYVEYGGLTQDTATNIPREFLPKLNAHNALQFEIAVKGQKQPVTRGPVSEADLQKAVETFAQNGGDLAWIKAVSSGQPRSPNDGERCAAAIIWIQAILSLPADQAARLLAM